GQGVLSARALLAAGASRDPRDREHCGSFWLARERARLRVVGLEGDPAYDPRDFAPGLRVCVDEASDLELVRALYARRLATGGSAFRLRDVLQWLRSQPALAAANRAVRESAANQAVRALEQRSRWSGTWRLAS